MLALILVTLVLVGIAILLLGIKIFFSKNGKFPNIHIEGNKEMHKRGIGCARSQM